ncbi:MAG: amidophosphoribosyltransferase, partial [Pseudomonadota bacterium]
QEQGTPAYMVASESVALQSADFTLIGDIKPGEIVVLPKTGGIQRHQMSRTGLRHTPCLFEYVYLARPASVIEGISVYEARWRIGEAFGQYIKQQWPDLDIDVVIPVPETSRNVAIPLALALNTPYREGFDKNHYVGRTFIMPTRHVRRRAVQQKLNIIGMEFKNRNVLLVDDSIVRGTTSKEIIQMVREAGAKNVYFASAAPEVRFPNLYGIDVPSSKDLVACNRTVDEIAEYIGADRLIYFPLEKLVETVRAINSELTEFETSIFDGKYVTGLEDEYLSQVNGRG